MKFLLLLALAVVLVYPNTDLHRYQQQITADTLSARLDFFASDFFEGRETGARGQKLAAHYLVSEYRQLGLSPSFQSFTVYRRTPKQTRLEVTIDNRRVASSTFSAEHHDDLSFFYTGGFAEASGGVVFGGSVGEKVDYNGKWLMILEDESTPFINQRSAIMKGKPKGVLIVSDDGKFAERAAQASLDAKRLGGLSLVESSDFPPTFAISTKLADQLLAPSKQTIANLKKQKPAVFELDKSVKVTAAVERSAPLTTENVVALIEGVDPKLKQEVLVISSHYDHLGINPALKGDQIFNGAADDGSGVVASLELARLFVKAKQDGHGPRRSILFIHFSGEEKGLLGSTYYSQRPIIPWERTVADINMDGVAGVDAKHPTQSKNYIYILGHEELSTELVDLNKRLNQETGVNLELTPNQGFGSDHYNFEVQFIPYLYYSTGLTEKYHQPGDEPNTIDYEHFARVVRLIFATAWQVANQDVRVRGVDRSRLSLDGYTCRPCPFACDDTVYNQPGECPVCGMALAPRYKRS
ncbi:MAG TPA: M28 family peptidase [Pyrinomonadaceae bacterium]|nr:M28 family peptidase [Pyrinomonadaceae bacterium]